MKTRNPLLPANPEPWAVVTAKSDERKTSTKERRSAWYSGG